LRRRWWLMCPLQAPLAAHNREGDIDGLPSTSSRWAGIEGDDRGVDVNREGLVIGGSFIFFKWRSKSGFFVRKLLKRHFEN
jgi:hypothetical protein